MNGHDENTPGAASSGGLQAASPAAAGSQNSGADATEPQAAAQGIYSTGDLAVDANTLPPELGGPALDPEAAAVRDQDNSARVSAALGKRLDYNRQRPSNPNFVNPFAAQNTQNHGQIAEGTVIATPNQANESANGDIRLTRSKKKNKAPLIILIALALLLVVGVVMSVVKGGGTKKISNTTLKQQYNTYMNYLVSGEESAEEVANLNFAYYDTAFSIDFQKVDPNSTYMQKLQRLLQSFQETYNELYPENSTSDEANDDDVAPEDAEDISQPESTTEESANLTDEELALQESSNRQNEMIHNYIYTLSDYIGFSEQYVKTGDFPITSLVEGITTSTSQGIKDKIGEFYKAYREDDGDNFGTSYAEVRIHQYELAVDYLSQFPNECLQGGGVDDACLATYDADGALLDEEFDVYEKDAEDFLESIPEEVVSYSKALYNIIQKMEG